MATPSMGMFEQLFVGAGFKEAPLPDWLAHHPTVADFYKNPDVALPVVELVHIDGYTQIALVGPKTDFGTQSQVYNCTVYFRGNHDGKYLIAETDLQAMARGMRIKGLTPFSRLKYLGLYTDEKFKDVKWPIDFINWKERAKRGLANHKQIRL